MEPSVCRIVPEILWGRDPEWWFPLCADKIVKNERYFNAGSLLINLEKFRKSSSVIEDGMKFMLENPKYLKWSDQSLLNYCFSEDTLILPLKCNTRIDVCRRKNLPVSEGRIVHYTTVALSTNTNDVWNGLLFKYLMKTPWFTEKIFANMEAETHKQFRDHKNISLRFANLLSGKERIFYITANKVDPMKKLFEIKEHEKITIVDHSDDNMLFKLSMSIREKKK